MSTDMKLGLVAGVLAVVGVAMFGMPKADLPRPVPHVQQAQPIAMPTVAVNP